MNENEKTDRRDPADWGRDYVKLPDSEFAVMQAVWDEENAGNTEEISAGILMEHNPSLAKLKLTTVLTLLTRLIGKKYLDCEKRGRVHYYRSLICEDDYKQAAAADFLSNVYRNQSGRLLNALWNGGALSAEDIRELKEFLELAERKDNSHDV